MVRARSGNTTRTRNNGKPLQDVVDETRALTLTGTVRFKAPALRSTRNLAGSRCQALSAIISFAAGWNVAPTTAHRALAYVAVNAVVARHAVDMPPQTFRSTGRAGQSFDLTQKPVVLRSQIVYAHRQLNGVDGWRMARRAYLGWGGPT